MYIHTPFTVTQQHSRAHCSVPRGGGDICQCQQSQQQPSTSPTVGSAVPLESSPGINSTTDRLRLPTRLLHLLHTPITYQTDLLPTNPRPGRCRRESPRLLHEVQSERKVPSPLVSGDGQRLDTLQRKKALARRSRSLSHFWNGRPPVADWLTG